MVYIELAELSWAAEPNSHFHEQWCSKTEMLRKFTQYSTTQFMFIVHLCSFEFILFSPLTFKCPIFVTYVFVVAKYFWLPLIYRSWDWILNIIKLILEQYSVVTECNALFTIYLVNYKGNFDVDQQISTAQPIHNIQKYAYTTKVSLWRGICMTYHVWRHDRIYIS